MVLEVLLSLIDGGPREAELPGGLRDRPAVDLDGAKGLVFELNQVVGIEEGVLPEQRVADFLRVAIEGATGAQRLDFFGVGRHGGSM